MKSSIPASGPVSEPIGRGDEPSGTDVHPCPGSTWNTSSRRVSARDHSLRRMRSPLQDTMQDKHLFLITSSTLPPSRLRHTPGSDAAVVTDGDQRRRRRRKLQSDTGSGQDVSVVCLSTAGEDVRNCKATRLNSVGEISLAAD